jgi:hypothetical protein
MGGMGVGCGTGGTCGTGGMTGLLRDEAQASSGPHTAVESKSPRAMTIIVMLRCTIPVLHG